MEESKYLGSDQTPTVPPTSDERTMAILSHILNIVAPILAPLIIYLVKKDESSYVAWHARESLNFQITVVLVCILLIISVIGLLVVWAVGIAALILVIIATIRASEGKLYKYPFTWRLIK